MAFQLQTSPVYKLLASSFGASLAARTNGRTMRPARNMERALAVVSCQRAENIMMARGKIHDCLAMSIIHMSLRATMSILPYRRQQGHRKKSRPDTNNNQKFRRLSAKTHTSSGNKPASGPVQANARLLPCFLGSGRVQAGPGLGRWGRQAAAHRIPPPNANHNCS